MIWPRYWGVVMFVKVFVGAVLASALGVFGALAQTAADVGGPRERPPADFRGQQFVDSRGCVFLRAGIGGAVNWVPRVDQNRKAMCGYPPTFGGGKPVAVAAAPAPAPAPAVAAAPKPQVAPKPVVRAAEPPPESYVPAPVRNAQAAPAPMPRVAPVLAAPVLAAPAPLPVVRSVEPSFSGSRIGCTRSAPAPQRLQLTNGGSVVVCTRGDGSLDGLRAPVYPRGAGVGASLTPPAVAAPRAVVPLGQPSGIGDGRPGARVAGVVPVPEGYRVAWEDDRLNPLRGVGTAQGQAMQDQVWTRKVPATLVADAPRRQRVNEGEVVLSAKNAPAAAAPKAAGGRVYVQVGSFGVVSNAAGAAARLAALGLPVAQSQGRIGGKAVQVVLAGPFGSAAEAQGALGAVRAAGFGDAFLR